MMQFTLRPVNSNVQSVFRSDGLHVGNLKRIGPIWKFKAVGYEPDGSVVPGGGPLTDKHNTEFAAANTEGLNAKLG